MFSKWWNLQHINGREWHPAKVTTLFGVPLCSAFYRAMGPYKSLSDAAHEATTRNRAARS